MRLPNDSERLLIIGKTGSGKTQAAVWHLSKRFGRIPWVIFDYKGDGLIKDIYGLKEINSASEIEKNGIYAYRPGVDSDDVTENFLMDLWLRGNVGLFFDEAYMLPNSKAVRAIATQGRSKTMPMIILTQRPVWISRFFLSEADFMQFFRVNDERDLKTLRGFMPSEIETPIDKYHSWYYDVADDEIMELSPVPERETILASFMPDSPDDEPDLNSEIDKPRLHYL